MDYLYFSIDNILQIVWACMAVAALCMLWLLWPLRQRVLSCVKAASVSNDEPESWPGVSVIIYDADNPERLTLLLNKLFEQKYNGAREIIVVNNGASAEVTDVINCLAPAHPELYVTFVPDDAHNLSRRKLGISLGVKAARHPYVILLSDRTMPQSDEWLQQMAAPFARGKEVVLGFAAIENLSGDANRFDEVATGVKWLSAAIKGYPYRGTGFNLGYKKSLFFAAKGFSRSLTLHNGDDDMFISQIANGDNTEVVITPQSLTTVAYSKPTKALRDLRMNHCFTGKFVSQRGGLFFSFSTLALWLWLVAVAVGITFSLPNLLPACVFVVMIPALLIPLSLTWRKTARALGIKVRVWMVVWHLLWRWCRNLKFKLKCGSTSRRNYTWLQH